MLVAENYWQLLQMEMEEELFQAKKIQGPRASELQSKFGLAQMHDIAVCKAPRVAFPQHVFFNLQFHAVILNLLAEC